MRVGRVVAIRQDLARVARIQGAPDGYAPSRSFYTEHGRFTINAVRAALRGYDAARNPVQQWCEAIRAMGFEPYRRHFHADRRRLIEDVRRVALHLGSPHRLPTRDEYREHGSWSSNVVTRHLGVTSWTDLGYMLKLTVEPGRYRGIDWTDDEQEAA